MWKIVFYTQKRVMGTPVPGEFSVYETKFYQSEKSFRKGLLRAEGRRRFGVEYQTFSLPATAPWTLLNSTMPETSI